MSHGPPDLPIHLVPPLGGLLSTRGGHGKGLQPCFTIRDNLTDRTTLAPLPAHETRPAAPTHRPGSAQHGGGPSARAQTSFLSCR